MLEGLGATLQEVSLPTTDAGLSTYYIIAPAECSSNLARYDGVRFGLRVDDPSLTEMYMRTRDQGFGAEVKRRMMLGTYALSSGYYDAYYRKAQKVRTVIAEEFTRVFQDVDALVCPTSPSVAFTMGERERPALDVPVRRRHAAGESRRPAGDIGAVRVHRRTPGWSAGDRAAVRGRARVPCGARI